MQGHVGRVHEGGEKPAGQELHRNEAARSELPAAVLLFDLLRVLPAL